MGRECTVQDPNRCGSSLILCMWTRLQSTCRAGTYPRQMAHPPHFANAVGESASAHRS